MVRSQQRPRRAPSDTADASGMSEDIPALQQPQRETRSRTRAAASGDGPGRHSRGCGDWPGASQGAATGQGHHSVRRVHHTAAGHGSGRLACTGQSPGMLAAKWCGPTPAVLYCQSIARALRPCAGRPQAKGRTNRLISAILRSNATQRTSSVLQQDIYCIRGLQLRCRK